MKPYEKEFHEGYKQIILQIRCPGDIECDTFLIRILLRQLQIFENFQIEDIEEKADAVDFDMRALGYFLDHQWLLAVQLKAITAKLMAEYEKEIVQLKNSEIAEPNYSHHINYSNGC